MKPAWLPDWRDNSKYPAADDLELTSWAWQFLRRNPEYQAAYERWENLISALPQGLAGLPTPEEDTRYYVFDPPAADGENYQEYAARIQRERHGTQRGATPDVFVETLQSAIKRQFGLSFMPYLPDSAEANPEFLWFDGDKVSVEIWTPAHNDEKIRFPGRRLSRFEAAFFVDLEMPIKKQIEAIERKASELQAYHVSKNDLHPAESRLRLANYPAYLKILDAKADGAAASEIAAVLLPNEPNDAPDYPASKKIRNRLRAAIKLRDREYLNIPI